MAFVKKEPKHKWSFESIGGTARVRISTGRDIANLANLDPKMWTVLSCPVKGLEIDEKSLAYIDADSDGKIRVGDVMTTSKWITSVLSDVNKLVKGEDSFDINDFNQEDATGLDLYNAARQILENLGKEGDVISIADTADPTAIFAKTRFNGDGIITEDSAEEADDKEAVAAAVKVTGGSTDRSGSLGVDAAQIEAFYKALADYVAWVDAEVKAPFGDKTDTAIAAYQALDAKVKDYFMRSKLAGFSPESTSALDVQTSRIEAISADDLSSKSDDIASYPIVRITGKAEIDLAAPVNPAWAQQWNTLKSIAVSSRKKVLTEEDWAAIGTQFAEYLAWKAAKPGDAVEALGADAARNLLTKDRKEALLDLVEQDKALVRESSNIDMVDKFLHIYRDFFRLMKNFITFHDFYSKDKGVRAIFQSGVLLIDQRLCRFCMNVEDVAKHSAAAASSGMYLVYCDCVAKGKPAKKSVVAAITVGDIGDIFVGKNAVYYDESGFEWDAVVTKIIDNPISVSQAFWSPYRRMATAVENLINKSAADKDAKLMKEATNKINAAPASLPADGTKPAAAPPFDIAKFAGIFAAIGMAVGMIGTALAALAEGIFALKWWQLILALAGIMLVISGPAMVMAWLKLRRRNIAPLLNANGWAINAASKISIPFGDTLTDIAKYPALKLKDPYAQKGLNTAQKWLVSLLSIAVVVLGLWLGNLLSWAGWDSPLPWFDKDVVEEVVAEGSVEQTETVTVDAQ
ncbi:MAG: hypothetical protein E7111_07300 [Bacteroidales bacterium]|nr:hypothetical protein [Bacteroidales bacterium]